MTQNKGTHNLDDAIRAVRQDEPAPEDLRAAAARVMTRLEVSSSTESTEIIRGCDDVQRLLPDLRAGKLAATRALLVEAHLRDCVTCRLRARGVSNDGLQWAPAPAAQSTRRWKNSFVFAAAAAVLVICAFFVNNAYFAIPAGARATVQSVDGTAFRVLPGGDQLATVGMELNEGEMLRTAAGSHAFLKLYDGSVVEVRERSEFSVERRGKDATIAMGRGAVIVQAAKRASGHLYVKTPDCRVAVTGTVFSVNSGIKGSRVSVVEGTVDVKHGGTENILHAGDQVSTADNMESVSVEQDISWSHNLPKHLALLAQFSQLQRRLESVAMPAPRFHSALLDKMPPDAVFFASLPNAGQALEDANRIMQEQIQQSPELREWWGHGNPNATAEMNEMVSKLRALSDYLGDEIVVVGLPGQKSGFAVVAPLRRSDVRSFLDTQFSQIGHGNKLQTITEKELRSLPETAKSPVALIRQNEVVFGADRDTLMRVDSQLNAGGGGLATTDFGRRLQEAYDRGAGFVFAADLHQIMVNASNRGRSRRTDAELDRSGFGDMRYLVLEHREVNGAPDNRMVLDFAHERRGIASWLAPPAPMGSLEFVSRNASVAVAIIGKDPQLMLNDVLNMDSEKGKAKQEAGFADAEAKLHLRIREDIVAHFGGDGALALDGPVLPTPSWKAIVEIRDADGLATSISKIAQAVNEEAVSKGKPGVELKTEDVNGQRYYTIQGRETGATPMYFTFAGGYMIIGPNRAVLMNTLRTRATGDSLARSAEFKAMLPKDQNANYSAIAYQNLGPILQPLLSTVSGEQGKIIQQLAADSKPSVICAWGRQNQIEAVTNSRLFGFDWMALGGLLNPGTGHKHNP